jgi:imidazole glycerol-phosphate synthase subunit HisF
MLRPRIIPCLLIDNEALVKTQIFDKPRYVGDPINAVKIFNEKQADELVVLDISATRNSLSPNFKLIQKLATECRMPLCYGGGVTSVEQVIKLVDMGVEKVAVSSSAITDLSLINKMVNEVGSQSIVIVLDLLKKKNSFLTEYEICSHNAKKFYKEDPFIFFIKCQEMGVGEIIINSVNEDGLMQGYDLDLVSKIKVLAKVPITFLGGAGTLAHIENLIENFGIVGAAAGSLFLFKGKYRAVLINYPTPAEKIEICFNALKRHVERVHYVEK